MIEKQQVVGLAGALQSLLLVNDIATKGSCSPTLEKPVFQSLLHYDPAEVIDAYGASYSSISSGLRLLITIFSNSNNEQRELAAYLLSAITIESKLIQNNRLLLILQEELSALRALVKNNQSESLLDEDDDEDEDEDSILHYIDNDQSSELEIINQLAEIYKQTASTIEPRIMIKGDATHLQKTDNANKIRALLLAALRGVAFYRQFDGTRLSFMLKRKQFIQIAKDLLNE